MKAPLSLGPSNPGRGGPPSPCLLSSLCPLLDWNSPSPYPDLPSQGLSACNALRQTWLLPTTRPDPETPRADRDTDSSATVSVGLPMR